MGRNKSSSKTQAYEKAPLQASAFQAPFETADRMLGACETAGMALDISGGLINKGIMSAAGRMIKRNTYPSKTAQEDNYISKTTVAEIDGWATQLNTWH